MRYTLYYRVYKDLAFEIAGFTTEPQQLRLSRLCGGTSGSVRCGRVSPASRRASLGGFGGFGALRPRV